MAALKFTKSPSFARTSKVVSSFIGIAILLGIGPQILGNTSFSCSGLSGFDTNRTTANDTGWASTCSRVDTDAANAFNLMLVVLIVIAAVTVLFVVRLL